MIKFFRKIRQKLLSENKFSKYLIYAIGEIVLVVVGILIALAINNWNEQKKNDEAEREYYCRILQDLELDKQKINEIIATYDNRIRVSKEILLELDSGKNDKNFLLNKFLIAFRGEAFVPRNVTFQDMVSSGNIRLITDSEIKNSLIQFYSELENKVSHLQQNSDENSKQTFSLINSSIEFGISEFNYVNILLGNEIIQTLPELDWSKDRNSKYYKDFQLMVVFNITMSDRNKQVINEIIKLMDDPYDLLAKKCK
ncbi:DUF6090 family protein [Croceitalea vernalis]|uniref:DUF6090 family protein n=1 Tax=Croceitalea vernalis TaxID=3075599 RepID=A0ABU3BKJ2_9FLAO|nr:DUF6090 family protein [Croceitalea sp. P007]MDT0622683.1 DUF6090 family protein [Croceitalea sp. P007]